MDPTEQNVIAARRAADKAEHFCTKMAIYVAEMQRMRDHYKNQIEINRGYVKSEAEAEANFVMYNKLLSDAHTKWTESLNSQAELWQKYCELLKEYEKNQERPDEKCTYCGKMDSDCGGDHGDDMRYDQQLSRRRRSPY